MYTFLSTNIDITIYFRIKLHKKIWTRNFHMQCKPEIFNQQLFYFSLLVTHD